jgi:hypothetical protein
MRKRDTFFFVFLGVVIFVIIYLVIHEFYLSKSGSDVTLNDLPVKGIVQNELPAHDSTIIVKPDSAKKKPEEAEFYIIVGSFKSRSESVNLAEQMRKKYTADIIVLPSADGENYRVSYGYYTTHEEAAIAIKEIRANIKSDAWIYQVRK